MASNINGPLPQSVGTTAEVNLLPCLHKVTEVFAKSHYGPMDDGSCTLKGKECVMCKTPVEGWNQDFIKPSFPKSSVHDDSGMLLLLKKMESDFHSE